VAIAAAAVEAPAVTVTDWVIVSAGDGGAAAPGVAADAVAPACETIAAAALCGAAAALCGAATALGVPTAEPGAAGPTAVEIADSALVGAGEQLADGALARAGEEAAGAGAAGGGRLPVGGKDAPPVPAVAALPGSLLRLLRPVT
jgi:hypothetical protein